MAASPERKARLAMKQRSYKIKSYVNASHAVRWKSGTGKKHNHTWEIVCELHVFEGMVSFFEIEKSLNKAINALSGQYLNDLPEFQVINPTVENVTEYLFNEIDSILRQNNAVLLRIEVSDSPTRSYCIDITERQFPTEAEVLPDQSAPQDDTDA
ncbi:6-pyruvoyl tetrahydropterin synthase [Levilactobacillus brevis]|uniref:6-carboxy-5,6,7,8-tetrahydropterin synthase n=3 Tax=Levilactobacillus brevis TaxID=1580 RepID=A0AAJ5FI47_LEVBR|nr:6-carboxytetrahydropterin synthase [Levilactobacillus brevis]AWP46531.1 6-pyruvoyl tetrahydropterin synthase [Levilactobacillus brevis]MCT3567365.1 6-pyruvoyl tetrahydropterin synthase [Levilactobacillus brevis]RAY08609.1 6-pyruvoyl tetrahydropterin synthase [Levilactobacillus brevis]TOZ03409.1 6-pyruvoyl tetrahydropterin synthase [Levilactobacillus brevis]